MGERSSRSSVFCIGELCLPYLSKREKLAGDLLYYPFSAFACSNAFL